MTIRTRMSISLDGCVTTPDGWPVQLADPAFVPGDKLGLIVLPLLLGGGMQLTPSVSTDTRVTLARRHALRPAPWSSSTPAPERFPNGSAP